MLHVRMCGNCRYEMLHHAVEKRSIDEMKHAEMLLDRILFLEGTPIVSNLHEMMIGACVEFQLSNDLEAEVGLVKVYNEGIRPSAKTGDNGTREFLGFILKDEEHHLDWLETQLEQIDQIGLQNYLFAQVG